MGTDKTKPSRFATLGKLTGDTSPIVGKEKLEEDRQSKGVSEKKQDGVIPTHNEDLPPVVQIKEEEGKKISEKEEAVPSIKVVGNNTIPINFNKNIRISDHHDELLDIYYALNKKSFKSKSELLYSIVEDFFSKKENKKYLDLKNNK